MFTKCAIFVDFENVRIRAQELSPSMNAYDVDFIEKLQKNLKTKGYNIINTYVYDSFESPFYKNKNILSRFAATGVTPKHVLSTNGMKNSGDIELCLDAYEICLTSNYDTFVIVSSDKDMYPLIKKLKINHKKVILVGVTFNTSNYIIKYVDEFIPLESTFELTYDQHHIVKQDLISAVKRLKDLIDWTDKKYGTGLGKDYYLQQLKETLFETSDYSNSIYQKLMDNNIIEEHTYKHNGNDITGVKIKSNKDSTDLLKGNIPNFF